MSDEILVIRGSSTLYEGEYDFPVKVYGSLKVIGDFLVRSLECYGSANIEGDLVIEEDLVVTGALMANNVTVNGNCSISGGVNILKDLECIGELELDGGARIAGDLKCSHLVVNGGLLVFGDIEVNNDCEICGGIRIEGDMRIGRSLVMNVSGKGEIRVKGDIRVGENLEIKAKDDEAKAIIGGDVIVQEDAIIEHTQILGELKATNVFLGKETIVKNDVYYVEEIKIDLSAKVMGRIIKIASI